MPSPKYSKDLHLHNGQIQYVNRAANYVGEMITHDCTCHPTGYNLNLLKMAAHLKLSSNFFDSRYLVRGYKEARSTTCGVRRHGEIIFPSCQTASLTRSLRFNVQVSPCCWR